MKIVFLTLLIFFNTCVFSQTVKKPTPQNKTSKVQAINTQPLSVIDFEKISTLASSTSENKTVIYDTITAGEINAKVVDYGRRHDAEVDAAIVRQNESRGGGFNATDQSNAKCTLGNTSSCYEMVSSKRDGDFVVRCKAGYAKGDQKQICRYTKGWHECSMFTMSGGDFNSPARAALEACSLYKS
jgi:hypothetical protein